MRYESDVKMGCRVAYFARMRVSVCGLCMLSALRGLLLAVPRVE